MDITNSKSDRFLVCILHACGKRCKQVYLPVLLASLFTGCATTEQMRADRDPWRNLNRPIHNLNHDLDTALLRPVAKAYIKNVPKPLQQGIANFFHNLGEPNAAINDLLQGKSKSAVRVILRFIMNSTLGIGGIFDPASKNGLKRHKEDFGQTLAVWGFGEGPYMVLPIMGPTTLRDIPSRVVSSATNPFTYVKKNKIRIPLGIVGTINKRAEIEDSIKEVDQSAMDRYIFVREAYRDTRQFNIYDGDPPIELFLGDDMFLDDEEFLDEDEDSGGEAAPE